MAETKTKKRVLNAVMVALCAVVVFAGAMAVTSLRDSDSAELADPAGSTLSASQVDGEEPPDSQEEFATEQVQQELDLAAGEGAAPGAGVGAASGSESAGSQAPSEGPSQGAAAVEGDIPAQTCSIEVRCDTILDNMGDLAPGKSSCVPANGVILAASTVRFAQGDTVLDVLKAASSATGLQLEYSYTPGYGSYYVEGINNLYEFDCGNESGWMYKVNGWFPNYGCSEYQVRDGDVIVWCYTCKGYGADLGASVEQ